MYIQTSLSISHLSPLMAAMASRGMTKSEAAPWNKGSLKYTIFNDDKSLNVRKAYTFAQSDLSFQKAQFGQPRIQLFLRSNNEDTDLTYLSVRLAQMSEGTFSDISARLSLWGPFHLHLSQRSTKITIRRAINEDSDQPAHPHSLIRVFAARTCLLKPPGYPGKNENPCHTWWMYRLI